jgi:hypothetical protein
MLVNEQGNATMEGTAQGGTYEAGSSGNTNVGLPVMANGAFGGYITGASVLNTTNSSVVVSVQYYDLLGQPINTPNTYTIGPRSSQGLYQGDSTGQGLPPNFYGSALVSVISGPTSSIIVTTNAQSDQFFYTYTEPNY